jgi:hypothetical protein
LTRAWRGEPIDGARPDIVEETDPPRRTVHITVIWDDWRNVDEFRRGEIIMDAFEAVRGSDKVLDVAVVMGLTPEQAERAGIKSTPASFRKPRRRSAKK